MRLAAIRVGFPGVAVAAVLLSAEGCTTAATPDAPLADRAHNARNSLDWPGTYRGVLPCADCRGIETVVILSADGTWRTQSRYLGKDGRVFAEQGSIRWNAAGSTITLEGAEPAKYFVAENRLIRLARDGSRISGNLAEQYVLPRLADGVTEKP